MSARQESIVTILENKGPSYIKDISMLIREVSEKTIQRELQVLVDSGRVLKEGERRWTRYSVA
jgi:DeoR/GlpR family transcriptional regulator of sugar metabolism